MSTDHVSAVVLKVVDLLQGTAALAGVQVEAGWPGDDTAAESVWVDEMSGELTVPASGAVPVIGDDEFRVPLEFRVSQAGDLAATGARLGEIVAAARDTLRAYPDLDDLAGTGWVVTEFSLSAAPWRRHVWRTPAGAYGAFRLEPAAYVRLLTTES